MHVQRIQNINYNNKTSFKGEFVKNSAIKGIMNKSQPEDLKIFKDILKQMKSIKDNAFFGLYKFNVEADRKEKFGEDVVVSYDLYQQDGKDNIKYGNNLTWFWEDEILTGLPIINDELKGFYDDKIILDNYANIENKEDLIEEIDKLLINEN